MVSHEEISTKFIFSFRSMEFFVVNFSPGKSVLATSFAYVAHFVFLRDVWIRSQRAADLTTHLPTGT